MDDIKQGAEIYELVYPHIHRYVIERVIEQEGELYAEVLVGYYKDKSKLIKIASVNTDLNLMNLKAKTLERIDSIFERRFKSRK